MRRISSVAGCLGIVAAACGSPADRSVDSFPEDPGSYDAGMHATTPIGGGPGDSGAPSTEGGSAIPFFVLEESGTLLTFDPGKAPSPSAFHTVGTLNCAATGSAWTGAADMAVDNDGVAWVTDRAGDLFRVSTVDATCEATPYRTGQDGFTQVAMGFASAGASGAQTLYVVDVASGPGSSAGLGLADIDLTSWALAPIGDFDGVLVGEAAELAGTPDGRLFGFFPNSTSSIAEIDPSSSHILSSTPAAFQIVGDGPIHVDVAFAYWSGLFYMFTADSAVAPYTDVSVFDPATGVTTLLMPQVGFLITGASTVQAASAQGM